MRVYIYTYTDIYIYISICLNAWCDLLIGIV